MKRYFLQLLVTAVGLMAILAMPTASAATYYVSLGDSLAVGVQPSGPPNHGYADLLLTQLQEDNQNDNPDLLLVKLGCPGETTHTMIEGTTNSLCSYYLPETSQLAKAVSFLNSHKGSVTLVTIDIGANELLECSSDPNCDINATLAVISSNLSQILLELRGAAGNVPIVGMNYYDPLLALWLEGAAGRAAATHSLSVVLAFNTELKKIYKAARVPVADVQRAFSTTDFKTQVVLEPFGPIPLNVARICQWTWMCPHPGDPFIPPDDLLLKIHPRDEGYKAIAEAFLQVLP